MFRDQPPSNQDGPFGIPDKDVSNFDRSLGEGDSDLDPSTAQRIARAAYDSSTNWLNAGRRAKWNDSLRAFQGLHPTGSKYLSRDYAYRSTLYRPKTRSMVRRDEAQTAAAFFSNEDVVSITAENDDDPREQASAEFMSELMQYRLTKSIPWFVTLVGARQDADLQGVAIGKAHWKYEDRLSHIENRPVFDASGQPMFEDGQIVTQEVPVRKVIHDTPVIDLLAPENFRFEPGADWRDPVKSSPYLIEMIPMYIEDVRAKVASGEWLDVSESGMRSATDLDDDVTRRARESGRVPGKDNDAWKPTPFSICWVRENIIRWGGRDWHYFTLGSAGEMLTLPRPLEEVYLHGERPYVVGFVVLETHKSYPASKVELTKDLQRAANDDWNLRFDAVKLNLNPRQFIKQGASIDPTDVKTFMPGKVIMVKDPTTDIVWDRPPGPDQSSYLEQDRINMDFDELAGSFSPSTMAAGQNPVVPETVGGMEHMQAPSASLNEYELRLFAETFVEPLLRLLVKLEQAYETDPAILALAGKRSGLLEKFGIDQITDDLLNRELTLRVNVGVGATNPATRLKNFFTGAQILGQIFGPTAAQGANFQEVSKEIFGMLGYKDGERFFQPGFDPRVAMLQQQLAKGQKGGQANDPNRLQAAQVQAQGRIQEQQLKNQNDQVMARNDYQRDLLAEQAENWRTFIKLQHDRQTAFEQRQHEMTMPRPAPVVR